MFRPLFTVALAILLAGPALAQTPLKISFQNGRVSVDANSVPVRTILNEWAKIGGTTVVGAERITGSPMTLKLVDVPEAQALETILRSAAGYMAAPRTAKTTGPSRYDRILVMATTSAPANANAARPSATPPNAVAATQRFAAPRQRPEQPEQEEADEPDENPPSPPTFTFPQPGTFTNAPPNAQPGMPAPAPQTITINPAQGGSPQPGMPVGVPRPGMVVPAPQPPPAPGMIRPPGEH